MVDVNTWNDLTPSLWHILSRHAITINTSTAFYYHSQTCNIHCCCQKQQLSFTIFIQHGGEQSPWYWLIAYVNVPVIVKCPFCDDS